MNTENEKVKLGGVVDGFGAHIVFWILQETSTVPEGQEDVVN